MVSLPTTAMNRTTAILAKFGMGADDALAPFLEERIRREQVRQGYWQSDYERSGAGGVSWSGMGPGPFVPATDEELIAGARKDKAFRDEWVQTPRGRFLAAIDALERVGFEAEAQQARSAYNRGFSPLSDRPCAREIGYAMHTLAGVPSHTAKPAIDALLDILTVGAPAPALMAAE